MDAEGQIEEGHSISASIIQASAPSTLGSRNQGEALIFPRPTLKLVWLSRRSRRWEMAAQMSQDYPAAATRIFLRSRIIWADGAIARFVPRCRGTIPQPTAYFRRPEMPAVRFAKTAAVAATLHGAGNMVRLSTPFAVL
jgi:hypothetical protein